MKQKEAKEVKEVQSVSPRFTGVARSVQCFEHQGHRNFKIVTLTIENDQVIRTELSDPYGTFEIATKLELANNNAIINLNMKWKDQLALTK